MSKQWTWQRVLAERESQLIPRAQEVLRKAVKIEESGATFDPCGIEKYDPFLIYTMPDGARFMEFLYIGFALSAVQINEAGEPIPETSIRDLQQAA